jgi:hypothetical protein
MTQSRRSFLKKLGIAVPAAVAFPQVLSGETFKPVMMKDVVIKTRPLGFQWETPDPFLFCVHHHDFFPRGNAQMGPDADLSGRRLGEDFVIKDGWRMYHGHKVPGFPGHPHVGFETITAVRAGFVDHSDSMGAAGRYGNGDVQWMTAGKGVQHSEMFPLLHTDKPNELELFQLWLNLPASSKKAEPHFLMLWSEQVPRYTETDAQGHAVHVEVLAGRLSERAARATPPESWAANADNHVGVFALSMPAGAQFALPAAAEGVNRSIYFYKGDQLKVHDTLLQPYHAADVDAATSITLANTGSETAEILVLQGRPIGEPVVQHGPFVGNSRADIQAAFAEYNRTQFGGWPWPGYEHVHPRDKERFALHAGGKEEFPPSE